MKTNPRERETRRLRLTVITEFQDGQVIALEPDEEIVFEYVAALPLALRSLNVFGSVDRALVKLVSVQIGNREVPWLAPTNEQEGRYALGTSTGQVRALTGERIVVTLRNVHSSSQVVRATLVMTPMETQRW